MLILRITSFSLGVIGPPATPPAAIGASALILPYITSTSYLPTPYLFCAIMLINPGTLSVDTVLWMWGSIRLASVKFEQGYWSGIPMVFIYKNLDNSWGLIWSFSVTRSDSLNWIFKYPSLEWLCRTASGWFLLPSFLNICFESNLYFYSIFCVIWLRSLFLLCRLSKSSKTLYSPEAVLPSQIP